MIRKCIVMAIKPEYAKAIYKGRKNWEFRKKVPPLFRPIYIYESAPVSAITGIVWFSAAITGLAPGVFGMVTRNEFYTCNNTGISLQSFCDYAGEGVVTALRVFYVRKFDVPIELKGRPPQNWGRFELVLVSVPAPEGDVEGLNEA